MHCGIGRGIRKKISQKKNCRVVNRKSNCYFVFLGSPNNHAFGFSFFFYMRLVYQRLENFLQILKPNQRENLMNYFFNWFFSLFTGSCMGRFTIYWSSWLVRNQSHQEETLIAIQWKVSSFILYNLTLPLTWFAGKMLPELGLLFSIDTVKMFHHYHFVDLWSNSTLCEMRIQQLRFLARAKYHVMLKLGKINLNRIYHYFLLLKACYSRCIAKGIFQNLREIRFWLILKQTVGNLT